MSETKPLGINTYMVNYILVNHMPARGIGDAVYIINYLLMSKVNDGNWKRSIEIYLIHWFKQVTLYYDKLIKTI